MLDNMPVIEQTGALKNLTEQDLKMLEQYSQRIGSNLCQILRHDPERIGVHMEKNGAWVQVNELILKFNQYNTSKKIYLNLPVLMEIVRTDTKQRYGLKMTRAGLKIRCNQGHSIPWIEMDYKVEIPPEILYHGTSRGFLDSIMKTGLQSMARQKVHLSVDYETAVSVGNRKRKNGPLVVFQVDAGQMARDGGKFYLSENDIWMADEVPSKYLHVMKCCG